ncbi:bck1-like resistance to osmotic shock [Malassezia psittaci]|uniref:BRO domain-containing protein 1 n=1 Tax=Malassezia psittaci TaxID=1821823 RepID=A0AAF0JDI9_9BASI|nr:bck1-like resistance to osmotic shock [Malassezia psittaci]
MQTPYIALPVKVTREVALAPGISALIRSVYEQSADAFREDLERVDQTRKDATNKLSSDATARDLLFNWFHMLEMLELRFPELRASFSWQDAFTGTEVTQQALAYEKASVIYNCAARISTVGMQLDRRDPQTDHVKRCYTAFRQAAGLLDYIHSNFLHAPSNDLGSKFVQSLKTLMLVQAAEVFLEKSIADHKGQALVSKLASHVAGSYASLAEEWQDSTEFGAIPAMWRGIAQYKAKCLAAVAQLYAGRAEDSAKNHGLALARYRYADKLIKEAHRIVANLQWFNYPSMMFTSTMPADTSAAATAQVKSVNGEIAETLRVAERDNDLVYHALLPKEDALPALEAINVSKPITIRETFAMPEVQRVLGPDIFPALVPLSVHESASVYSEEQAKLVRTETERVEQANEDLQAALASIDANTALSQYASLNGQSEPPKPSSTLLDHASIVASGQSVGYIQKQLAAVTQRNPAESLLRDCLVELDEENRTCERLRVQHEHRWTQEPIGVVAGTLRRNLVKYQEALHDAQSQDQEVASLWNSVYDDVALLHQGPEAVTALLRKAARSAHPKQMPSLVDLDEDNSLESQAESQAAKLLQDTKNLVYQIQEFPKQRNDQLQELKARVRGDDISRALLLNRRVENVEPKLFAAELAKYTPLQSQLMESIEKQATMIDQVRGNLEKLATHPGTSKIRKQREASAQATTEIEQRLTRAFHAYTEVSAVLGSTKSFHQEIQRQAEQLHFETTRLLSERRAERERLLSTMHLDSPSTQNLHFESHSRQDAGRNPAYNQANRPTGSISDDLHALRLHGDSSSRNSGSNTNMSNSWLQTQSRLNQGYAKNESRWPDPPSSTMYQATPSRSIDGNSKPKAPPRPPRI